MSRPQLTAQLDPAPVRQTDVEKRHIRRYRRQPPDRVGDGAGLTDDFQVFLGFEHVADPATNNLVVVDKEDPQSHRGQFFHTGSEITALRAGSTGAYTRVVEHMAGPRQLRRLLEGVLTVGSDLDLQSVLRTIIATATDLVQATYGALGVLDPSGTRLTQFVTVGIDDEGRAAIGHIPEGHGILGLLIIDPHPLRLPDLNEHPDRFGFPPNHPPMTSFLGVPITVRGQVYGNLYLCDKAGDDVFTDVDEELVVGLAAAAGIAIDNARLHARVAELATVEDRERIARDLHDTVIQRLFAIGLSLQATMRLVSDPVVSAKLFSAVDDLDATVRDVRAAIFELHTVRLPGRSVRQELLQLCAESARAVGFDPVIRFDGPIDSAVDDDLADELFAVVREALTNVAKHAKAMSAHVWVGVRDGILSAQVADDGVGIQAGSVGGRGIENLRARADRMGGTFELRIAKIGGTELLWRVPLEQSAGTRS